MKSKQAIDLQLGTWANISPLTAKYPVLQICYKDWLRIISKCGLSYLQVPHGSGPHQPRCMASCKGQCYTQIVMMSVIISSIHMWLCKWELLASVTYGTKRKTTSIKRLEIGNNLLESTIRRHLQKAYKMFCKFLSQIFWLPKKVNKK
jgi:hypothetical protein